MRHSLDYKVPQGVKQGIYYCLEEDGAAVTFCNGDMANRQEKLIRGFNHLASACNDYHEVQEWFNSVPDHVNTDLMEAKRKTYLDALQTERAAVVGLMAQILQAGAEPLPPDHMLDSDVSVILSTRGLRDAAVDAAGGQQAVESFRQSAAEYMKAAIIRNRLELIQEAEIDLNEQKDLAEKRAAEAEARLNAELQINAEGPTSAVMRRHDDAELQRQRTLQEGLEKLHAARERRRRP